MFRHPPRPTLFPYRRSSDLGSVFETSPAPVRDVTVEALLDASTMALIISAGIRACCKRINSSVEVLKLVLVERDRKSTRLNSSHGYISYAVFCLKKKK